MILAKATLGELGGGDTHGSLFGSTRNPYDSERTVGGSSGGSGGGGFGKFFHGGRGPGRLGFDPPAIDLELHRRHAPFGRLGQPRRRLRLLAGDFRLSRPDGADA